MYRKGIPRRRMLYTLEGCTMPTNESPIATTCKSAADNEAARAAKG
jgi:hypothetical protein